MVRSSQADKKIHCIFRAISLLRGSILCGYFRCLRFGRCAALQLQQLVSSCSSFQMAMKRVFGDEKEQPAREAKRALISLSEVLTVVANPDSAQEFWAYLEPRIRNVVQEEMERALQCYLPSASPCLIQTELPQARRWKLHFLNQFPRTLFTCSNIETEDGKAIQVVVLDSDSNEVVNYGPLSSLKAEILVLQGDFGKEDVEDWTKEEFNAGVISERKGKPPLLTGELVVTINNGVGCLGKAIFTDNSSWTKSRKFRIGIRAIQSTCPEVRVKEARSEAFVVKDHRGESYRKHHPPSLNDDVWRLEGIGKDGCYHKKLSLTGIRTVEEFLKVLVMDSSRLRNNILGGLSDKKWQAITQHAWECPVNDKLYEFFSNGVGLRLNSVHQVVGAAFNGEGYRELDELTAYQMGMVETLKKVAYNNQTSIHPVIGQSSLGLPSPLHTSQPAPIPGSSLYLQHQEAQPGQCVDIQHPITNLYNELTENASDFITLARMPSFSQFEPSVLGQSNANSTTTLIPERHHENSSDKDYSFEPIILDDWTREAPQLQALFPNDLFEGNHYTGFGYGLPRKRTKWFMLKAVLKVGISMRKDIAARRMPSLVQYFPCVRFQHIPRQANHAADFLANFVLDRYSCCWMPSFHPPDVLKPVLYEDFLGCTRPRTVPQDVF